MNQRQKQTMLAMKKTRGVTLVELMIALVISTIVLLGVATVYSSTKRSYKVQEEMARLQENARYAFAVMAQDIRGAGFVGCNPKINSLLDETDPDFDYALYDFQAGVDGWEFIATGTAPGDDYSIASLTNTGAAANWAGADWDGNGVGDDLPNALTGRVLVGTDVLLTKSADAGSYADPLTCPDGSVLRLQGANLPNATAMTFNCATNVEQGQIVMFGNCDRADVFQNGATSLSVNLNRNAGVAGNSPGNVNPALVRWSQYCENCQIYVARGAAYFIGNGAGNEPALFRYDYSRGASHATYDELVEGVESMQILYGEDLNTGDDDIQPTRYVTADLITNPDNVVSVRISLLVRTPQELNRPQVTTTNRLLGVDDATGVDITSQSDRRIRKVFTTTVYMRNKGLVRERP
jgi:type IV pilus assembly protein PilW